MSRILLCAALSCAAVLGQPRPRDLCTPPPSGSAPALPAKLLEGQGNVHFPITTANPEAQKYFDQGVAQMHSFWAREAERSFRQAAELDPAAPMPWWGVAMVAAGDYRPRFQIETFGKAFLPAPRSAGARAREAAERAQALADVPGKASEIERLYIAAVAARRDPNLKNPDEAYTGALRRIASAHPEQVEAKLYLALHTMQGFTLPEKKPVGTSMESAALLRELLRQAPDHPGVHHYVIHGFEGSTFASDAWPSCERYAALAPNIPHALHMPGHIYSQTDRWPDAAKSFEAAAENELKWIRSDALYGTGHHGHNMHYLAVSRAFQGEFEKAREAAHSLLQFRENPRESGTDDNTYSAYAQGWFAMMRVLVQSEDWDRLLDGSTLPEFSRPRHQAWRHWARGVAFAARGELDKAVSERRQMETAMARLFAKTRLRPEELGVARAELDAHILLARGKVDRGLRALDRAGAAERRLVYSEPPFYPRPVYEALGRLALKHNRPRLAEHAFRQALEQYPGSKGAQTGLRAAATALETAAGAP